MSTQARTDLQTLAQRLAEGPLPAPQALHYALALAEALRQMHDAGKAHGSLTPWNIALSGAELTLMEVLEPSAADSPYAAPELRQGCSPDARSDIFAFGAIAYEMFTGRRALETGSANELHGSPAVPPPTGNAALDRIAANCMAPDPANRWQRIQKVILELRFVAGAVQRSAEAVAREQASRDLRSEVREIEARLTARLRMQENTILGMQMAPRDEVAALQNRISGFENEISAAQERYAAVEQNVAALHSRFMADLERTMGVPGQRIAALEQGMNAFLQGAAGFREDVEARMRELERKLQLNGMSIDSLRASQEQTDDLVERIMEILGPVQTGIFDRKPPLASHADDLNSQGSPVREVAGSTEPRAESSGASGSPDEATIEAHAQDCATIAQALEAVRDDAAALREDVDTRLREFDAALNSKGAIIDSLCSAQEQTDELIERVMHCIESLQTTVLSQPVE